MYGNIYIFTAGADPVPAVNGGGVESLITTLMDQNELDNDQNKMIVYSIYDDNAEKIVQNFSNTEVRFWNIPKYIVLFDRIIWGIMHEVLRRETIVFRNLFQRWYVIGKSKRELKKILKSDSDNVVVFEHSILLLHAMLGQRKNENRVYFHAHNNIAHTYPILNTVIKKLDGVISVSRYLAESNLQLYKGCKRQIILKNGIDLCKFNGTYDVDKYHDYLQKYNSDGKKIILFIGRICEQKGVIEVIKAFKLLKRKDTRLLISGAVFYKKGVHSEYESMAIKEAENSDVVFTGFVDCEDVPILYHMAYVSVLPSKRKESAGLVMIESMACGTPVITTREGGIPEYVGNNARYVPVGDKMINAIARELQNILDEKEDVYEAECTHVIEGIKEYNASNFYKNFMNEVAGVKIEKYQ